MNSNVAEHVELKIRPPGHREGALRRSVFSLAQKPPFQFVDHIISLDNDKIVAEFCGGLLPHHFIADRNVEGYVILEFAAQASGILIADRKRGGRGVISSFRDVTMKDLAGATYPIMVESRIIECRSPMYSFEFSIFAQTVNIASGIINIFTGE